MVTLTRDEAGTALPYRPAPAPPNRNGGPPSDQAFLLRHYAALWEATVPDEDEEEDEEEEEEESLPNIPGQAPPRYRTSSRAASFSGSEMDFEYNPTGAPGLPQINARPALPFRHTRLFRIQRSMPRLEIDLRAFALDAMPDYIAVSHRWGEEKASTVIKCNDKLLMLKPSLVECIRNVSSLFVSIDTWFWVDGVCIEQNDEEEKAQQVKMLWKIFGDAAVVPMYLGEGDEDSDSAIAAIRVSAKMRNRRASQTEWLAIRRLLHRPWFKRLWTMQEAILAQQILVICGTQSVDWQDVAYVHGFVTNPQRLDGPTMVESPSLSSIINLRRWREEQGERSPQYFTEILQLMFAQQCYFEVDRVYAVLGLFPPDVMAKIDVDYSCKHRTEYWATYRQFCEALLTSVGRHNGLVNEKLRHLSQKSYTCPGDSPRWCPDFSRPLPELVNEEITGRELQTIRRR